jgi:Helix-turn-helix
MVYIGMLHRVGAFWLKTLHGRGYRSLVVVLIEVRKRAGLTQIQLAGRLWWPQSRVAKVEVGYRRIDPVECAAWAKGCGMTPKAFFIRFAAALERKGLR